MKKIDVFSVSFLFCWSINFDQNKTNVNYKKTNIHFKQNLHLDADQAFTDPLELHAL